MYHHGGRLYGIRDYGRAVQVGKLLIELQYEFPFEFRTEGLQIVVILLQLLSLAIYRHTRDFLVVWSLKYRGYCNSAHAQMGSQHALIRV